METKSEIKKIKKHLSDLFVINRKYGNTKFLVATLANGNDFIRGICMFNGTEADLHKYVKTNDFGYIGIPCMFGNNVRTNVYEITSDIYLEIREYYIKNKLFGKKWFNNDFVELFVDNDYLSTDYITSRAEKTKIRISKTLKYIIDKYDTTY